MRVASMELGSTADKLIHLTGVCEVAELTTVAGDTASAIYIAVLDAAAGR